MSDAEFETEMAFRRWARGEWLKVLAAGHDIDDSYSEAWKDVYGLFLQAFIRGMRHAADITAARMGKEFEAAGYKRGFVFDVCYAAQTIDPASISYAPLSGKVFE